MVLVTTLNSVTMDELQLFREDTIIIRYAIQSTWPQTNLIFVVVFKKWRDTVLICLSSDDVLSQYFWSSHRLAHSSIKYSRLYNP